MKSTFTLLTLKKWNRHLARITVIVVSMILMSLPVFSQITAPNVSRCGEGVVTLNATTSLTGGTLTWYDVPFFGTPVATGIVFTTPVLQESTTFYVDYVVAGVGVCDRKPVNAIISTSSVTPSIFYASVTYCSSLNEFQAVTNTGSALGQYTSSPALTSANLNSTTGAFNPFGLSPGQYTITYTIAPANQPVGCNEAPSSVVLNVELAPVQAVIYYGSTAPNGETPAPAVSYCTNSGTITVHRNTESPSTGTYSATPSGLSLNSTTGAINTANSLSGTYTITYFVPGVGGCSFIRATANTVTILQLPTASISYATPFCNSESSNTVTLNGTGIYTGGTFTATGGLAINSSTGTISTPATAGTYTISYTLSAVSPCAQVIAQTTVVVLPVTSAAISGTTAICSGGSTNLSIALTGTSPWSFTYTDGATPITITDQVVSTATISVSPFSTKTYTLTSVNDAHCAGTTSGSATITVSIAPLATFEYSGSPFCSDGADPSPNMLGVGTKGSFSSTEGLVFVSAATGVIDLSASTAGTYTVTNNIAATGGCSTITATSNVIITKLPIANFTYTSAAYCTNGTNPSPVMGEEAVKGLFSSTAGLEFVSLTTGEINLSASTPGNYTITNTVAAATGCDIVTSTTLVEIKAIPTAVAGYNRGVCIGKSTTLGALQVGTNTYSWSSVPEGFTSTSAQPTVSPTVTTTYTLVESNGSCSNTHSVNVEVLSLPAANDITGTNLLCAGTASVSYSVTDHSNNGGLYEWQYTGTGATINAITTYTTTINFAENATSGTLRLIEDIGGCSTTNAYEITVNPLPSATIAGTTTLCQNSTAPNITFTGANGTAPYTFTYNINTGSDLTVTTTTGNSVMVGAPTTDSGLFTYTLISVKDASSTTCLKTVTGSATITVDEQVTTANVGSAQNLCNTYAATLDGNLPTVGTGAWSVVSKPEGSTVAFGSAGVNNTTATVDTYGAYTYKWTITNGTCTSNADVTFNYYQQVTTAGAGDDQANCNSGNFTLAGNAATVGQGTWTVTSGTASITSLHSATSGITGLVAGTSAVLRWTIVNGACSSYDEVTLVNKPIPTLTGVSLPGTYCDGETAKVFLEGLLDNEYVKVDYTIDGVPYTTPEIQSNAGNAQFTTAPLTAANNGKNLQITGLTDTGSHCSATFAMDVTLSVKAISDATATVNTPITAGTSVTISGTSTIDDLITIYKNGTFLGSAIPTELVWSTTNNNLNIGDKISASVTEPGKCEGSRSAEVTVTIGQTATPTVISPIGVGTFARIYIKNNDAATANVFVYKNGTLVLTYVDIPSGQQDWGETTLVDGDIITAKAVVIGSKSLSNLSNAVTATAL